MRCRGAASNFETCTSTTCSGGCARDDRRFYASAIREGGDVALLLGPFQTHQDAIDAVDGARRAAEEVDLRACWYSYGTVLMDAEGRDFPDGRLNGRVA